jgi:hypothetical protein
MSQKPQVLAKGGSLSEGSKTYTEREAEHKLPDGVGHFAGGEP